MVIGGCSYCGSYRYWWHNDDLTAVSGTHHQICYRCKAEGRRWTENQVFALVWGVIFLAGLVYTVMTA